VFLADEKLSDYLVQQDSRKGGQSLQEAREKDLKTIRGEAARKICHQ